VKRVRTFTPLAACWTAFALAAACSSGSSELAALSQIYPALRTLFPGDRMAYMGYDQDNTTTRRFRPSSKCT
jgi:hypothetical protein